MVPVLDFLCIPTPVRSEVKADATLRELIDKEIPDEHARNVALALVDTRKDDLARLGRKFMAVFLGLAVAGSVAIGAIWYTVNHDSARASETRELADQNHLLATRLCGNLAKARKASNEQIRKPLKQSLLQWVGFADEALKNPGLSDKERNKIVSFRMKFKGFADDVVLVKPSICNLEGDNK